MDPAEGTTNRNEQKSRKFLKSLIRRHPQELLLVIGTGVSAAVAPGIPALCSWRSCIEAVIEAADQLEVLHPGDVDEFRKKVAKDRDLLVVAHDLIRKMSPRTGDTKPNFFQDCLMEVFDNLEQHIQNPGVLQSILRLMERGTMVLTTNYDNLLEIFGQQQNKPMESLDLKDKDRVLQWAKGHIKYGVLHIHGLYTDPCGMVLDPLGYKDVTQDPEVMEALQNLYRTKAFLFLGCGETLRDQIFQALFLYTVKNKVGLEHYMLVRKENEDQFFKLQADMLLHGIKVVSYGDCFESFAEYVQDLTTQICKQRSPDADRVDSTTLLGGQSNEKTTGVGMAEEQDGPSAARSLEPSGMDGMTQSIVRSGPGVHPVMQDKRGRPGPGGSLANVLNGCTLQEGSGGGNCSTGMCSDMRKRRQRALVISKVNDRLDLVGKPLRGDGFALGSTPVGNKKTLGLSKL